MQVVFIETQIFTGELKKLLSDDEYIALQRFLSEQPLAGDVIQDTGGLRKIRWHAQGKGKRGGVRVIYYYVMSYSQIRLLLIYQKGKKDDLTAAQKKILKQLNQRW